VLLINLIILFHRPKAVTYPQNYIDMLKREVTDVNRALTTSYWFDDDDNDYEKQRREMSDDNHEFEIIPPSKMKKKFF
jgi:hypothetical protein